MNNLVVCVLVKSIGVTISNTMSTLVLDLLVLISYVLLFLLVPVLLLLLHHLVSTFSVFLPSQCTTHPECYFPGGLHRDFTFQVVYTGMAATTRQTSLALAFCWFLTVRDILSILQCWISILVPIALFWVFKSQIVQPTLKEHSWEMYCLIKGLLVPITLHVL